MMGEFDEEAAHNRGSLLETFRGREAGTQKPQQDAHCNKGDHTETHGEWTLSP